MRRCDQVMGVLLLLLSAGVLVESRGLVYREDFSPGAGFFPIWLGISLAILSVTLLLQSTVFRADGGKENPLPGKEALVRVILIATALLVAIVLFERAGFLLSMFVFVAFLLIYLEGYRWYAGIGISGGTVFAIYALFKLALDVRLPSGLFLKF